MPNGNAVTNLSLAASEYWTDKQSGEKVEHTEWHHVALSRKLEETAGKYTRKARRFTSKASADTRVREERLPIRARTYSRYLKPRITAVSSMWAERLKKTSFAA